jgi:MFS superfamily sulfate permease-like transporter
VVILGLRRLWSGFPGVIVAVGLGIAAVAAFDLTEQGVQVIGVLPQGLPSLAFPEVRLGDLPLLFGGALGIALVAVADTTVLSQSLATRRREVVDPRGGAAGGAGRDLGGDRAVVGRLRAPGLAAL